MMPTPDYTRRAHNSLCTLLEHIHDKTIEVVSTEDMDEGCILLGLRVVVDKNSSWRMEVV